MKYFTYHIKLSTDKLSDPQVVTYYEPIIVDEFPSNVPFEKLLDHWSFYDDTNSTMYYCYTLDRTYELYTLNNYHKYLRFDPSVIYIYRILYPNLHLLKLLK